MQSRRTFKLIDKPFLASLVLLLAAGLVVLFSASSGVASDPYMYVKKQITWIVFGIVVVIAMLRVDYSHIGRYNRIVYLAANLLLICVLQFGVELRGSQGWLKIGGFMFQVAEFAKILVILSFAEFLNKRQGNLNTLGEIIPCFLYVGLPFLLVVLQPDLGTALTFGAILFGMLFVAGANPRILLLTLASLVLLAVTGLVLHQAFGMWLPLEDYQIKRLTVFIDPYNDGLGGRGAGWNTIQSLVAVGSGGLFGKGLFQGTQAQLNFLPEQHTDFIFAVIGEELGFLGGALILVLFAILLSRAINIAYHARDFYSTLVAAGIISMWTFHVFENIGMSIGFMPITGIPLPFISYGGSFMLANMIAVGLILDINIKRRKIVF